MNKEPDKKTDPASPEQIEEARQMFGDTDIEIDDDAQQSAGSDGAWIQAWVWVPNQ